MTCINCKYQWCWLCEGEYKYGHYDSGRCKDQWPDNVDYPKEINNNDNCNEDDCNYNFNWEYNYNLPNYFQRNIKCNFGLHRIFRCICPNKLIDLDCSIDEVLSMKYHLMLIFWLFGIIYMFVLIYDENLYTRLKTKRDCIHYLVNIFAISTGVLLFVSYQIAFTCLTTPFILVCLIYHKFFDIFLIFFGIEY